MQDLQHKSVFITGASSGIGMACALMFAKQGANLILAARREDKLAALAVQIKAINPQISLQVLNLDVQQRQQVAENLANIGPIDILVNNAGLAAGLDKIQEANIDDWENMINTNVKGLLYVTKAILPAMLQRNSGHIINIGSVAAHLVYPGGSVYCATKAVVRSISAGLRQDILGSHVRVSEIDPGMVETEFSKVRFKGDTERADKVYEGLQPLTADDVADAVIYCATRKPHINIAEMILYPTMQAGTSVYREA
jgi:serine 3-dehydrogenase